MWQCQGFVDYSEILGMPYNSTMSTDLKLGYPASLQNSPAFKFSELYHCLCCSQPIRELWRSPFWKWEFSLLIFKNKDKIFTRFFKTLSSGDYVKMFICLSLSWSFHLPVSQNKKGFISVWCRRTIDRKDTPYWFGTIFIVAATFWEIKYYCCL